MAKTGIPATLAKSLSARLALINGLDIVEISHQTKKTVEQIASIYFGVAETLGIEWLEDRISGLEANNIWHQRARFSLSNELRSHHARIVQSMLQTVSGKNPEDKLEAWKKSADGSIKIMDQKIRELKQEHTIDFSMLSVLVSELNNLK